MEQNLTVCRWPDTYENLWKKALTWISRRYQKGTLQSIPENLKAKKDILEEELDLIWLEDKGIEEFRSKCQEWCRLWLEIEACKKQETSVTKTIKITDTRPVTVTNLTDGD